MTGTGWRTTYDRFTDDDNDAPIYRPWSGSTGWQNELFGFKDDEGWRADFVAWCFFYVAEWTYDQGDLKLRSPYRTEALIGCVDCLVGWNPKIEGKRCFVCNKPGLTLAQAIRLLTPDAYY